MWTQWWIVDAKSSDQAIERVKELVIRWTPKESEFPAVTDARYYTGPDDLAVAEQYAQELADIHRVVSESPRHELVRRFSLLNQRSQGIPPRPGWVMTDAHGPRSPRPVDWSDRKGPRWVVTVKWPGDPPNLTVSDTP